MRGDSIRDLYAKSLALLGLALLGAIGAAVDYWPADLATPFVAAIDLSAAGPRPLSDRALFSTPEPVATSRVSVVVNAETPSTPAPVPASTETVTVAEPEPVAPPPALELPPLVPAAFTGIDGGEANELELTAVEAPRKFTMTTVAPAQAANTGHQSLLAGIGSGIADGTVKAGAVVIDGLKTVGGAVGGALNSLRKRFPFFSSGPKVGLPASNGLQ
jgi:hypothetical protein